VTEEQMKELRERVRELNKKSSNRPK